MASDMFKNKKERQRTSQNRTYDGDYGNFDNDFGVQQVTNERCGTTPRCCCCVLLIHTHTHPHTHIHSLTLFLLLSFVVLSTIQGRRDFIL